MFVLYYASGKVLLQAYFGDENFIAGFKVEGKKIIFAFESVIDIAEYVSEDRAFEVYDAIVNAYNAEQSFTLPAD